MVLVLAAAAAAVIGWRWWSSPERLVHRTLDAIEDRLTHDAPVTGLAAVAAAAGLQDSFTIDAVAEPGPPFTPIAGRDALVGAAARLIGATPALHVEFVDRKMSLEASTAQVACNVVAVVRDRAGQETRDARELRMTLVVREGRWQIERVNVAEILEPVQ